MTVCHLPADAHILVIDDEFLVLWALQDSLERLGFRHIRTAANVGNGLELVEDDQFAFAFIDVNLGGQKSFPIAQALDDKGIPFAFVTGYGRAGLDGHYRDATVLTKPVTPKAISAVVALADEG